MKVLVIGGGGREHALAWKLSESEGVDEVIVAPGNAGTANEAKVRNIPVAADDIHGLLNLAQAEGVGFTLVGPEAPLVAGIVDLFTAHGLDCFGPSQGAAQLEGSKDLVKNSWCVIAYPQRLMSRLLMSMPPVNTSEPEVRLL